MKRKWIPLLRMLPFAVCAALGAAYLLSGREMSIDAIVSAAPENPWLAALFLVLLFGAKSMSVLLPLIVLYLAGGCLFPPGMAVAVNTAGLALCLTLPYWVGRISGEETVDRLGCKYPRLRQLAEKQRDNDWFISFFLRIISCLPGDVVSMYLGALKIPFWPYLTGSLAGSFPGVLVWTLLGQGAADPSSPKFFLSAGGVAAVTGVTLWGYFRHRRKVRDAA